MSRSNCDGYAGCMGFVLCAANGDCGGGDRAHAAQWDSSISSAKYWLLMYLSRYMLSGPPVSAWAPPSVRVT